MTRHALILTAGLGTRLRPLTDVRAKPAIPVAGKPLIRRIIAWLVAQGVGEIVLNLHHRPETLTAIVGDGADLGARVRYSWEQPRILGSAGGPRLARPLIGAGTFLIINGDTLTDVDVARVAAEHTASGAHVTLALVPNREFARYGGVLLDSERRVVGFAPRGPRSAGSYHYIGVQIVDGAIFDAVPAGEAARSIGGIYDALIASRPGAVRGSVCNAAFWDVGTVADYWRTSEDFLAKSGAAGSSSTGSRVRIDASARVTRSILWDDVEVGAKAVLDECIVTDRVRVAPGATYRRAVLIQGDDDQLLVSPLNLEPENREP